MGLSKRNLWIVIGGIVGVILLAVGQLVPNAIPTAAWGLHFTGEGLQPSGPASTQQLKQYDAYFVGNRDEKVLYLTFDAGYENGHTAEILQTLKKHRVPAAFFLVGDYLKRNGDLVRQMVAEGHLVCNHTMTHPNMSEIGDLQSFGAQLQGVEDLFREITGKELPKFYRPPQGVYSEENLKMAKQMGYTTVFWSLAYADWNNKQQPTRDYAFSKLLPRTHNGAVILLHATSATNAQILDELLTRWKDLGYRFAPLTELP